MPARVDVDILQSLLGRQDSPDLMRLSTWHPDRRDEVLELAKHVAAMESQTTGGYIIVGSPDTGRQNRRFSPRDPTRYSEARVRTALAAVLEEPLGISTALHQLDGQFFLLIAVERHPDGLRIMSRDGQYGHTSVWRRGDVFVRWGTNSMRWDQARARALIEQIVDERVARRLAGIEDHE